MRNVNFYVTPDVALRIRRLQGRILSKRHGQPVNLDDKRSFVLAIGRAEVGLTGRDLSHLMNEYVFQYPGAPLRGLRFSTVDTLLRQRGIIHKGVNLPFDMTATISVTPDGHLRLRPVSLKVLGVKSKGLMHALGITLGDLLDLKGAAGVSVQGNDLLLEPDSLLPPPAIRGRVRAVRVAPDELILTFGDSAAEPAPHAEPTPPDRRAANYIYLHGGTLHFGKLFMVAADLELVDADPHDPFDFSLDRYNAQLVAGYARPQPNLGLVVVMPDWPEALGGPHASRPPNRGAAEFNRPHSRRDNLAGVVPGRVSRPARRRTGRAAPDRRRCGAVTTAGPSRTH
jgi:hypothetical protein